MIELIPIPEGQAYPGYIAKINELVAAYNELEDQFEHHYHTLDLGNNITNDYDLFVDPPTSKPIEATELGGDDHE